MATISSHILDSVTGDHASGIQVQCYLINSLTERTLLFDVTASDDGRIAETIDIADTSSVELIIQSADYFSNAGASDSGKQIMPQLVVRLELPDATLKYHVPIMLSPHSCSIWWAGM